MGTILTRTVHDDNEWEKMVAALRARGIHAWACRARSRFFRAGETSQVFLSAVWAMVVLYTPQSLSATYLAKFMPLEAWAALFSLFTVAQFVSLLNGDLASRLGCSLANSALWGFVATIVIYYTPAGSALGPTLCVLTAGCLVTSAKLYGLLRQWPLG